MSLGTDGWYNRAFCKGDENFDRWFRMMPHEVRDMQDICALCPCRKPCAKAAFAEEEGLAGEQRYGFRAYMTPMQRAEIANNGGLRGRDPLDIVEGMAKKKKRK